MRTVHGFTQTAGLLALALTLGCSGGDDNGEDGDQSSSSNQEALSSPSGVNSSSGGAVAGNGSSSGMAAGGSSPSYGGEVSFSDKGNDISNYKTVEIGTQVWMAENLNYDVPGSKCYGEGGVIYKHNGVYYVTLSSEEIQANCDKYGRLYDWATAMALPSNCNDSDCSSQINAKHHGICPTGWHIPSEAEFKDVLFVFLGGGAFKKLKATSGWDDYNGASGNGTDDYGFAALPGGSCLQLPDGYEFDGVGRSGWLWTASPGDGVHSDEIKSIPIDNNNNKGNIFYAWNRGTILQSVRCVKD